MRVPHILRVKIMEMPSILQGESFTRLVQGAMAGVAATIVIGFGWGGWTLGSNVEKLAKERADTAVVAVLAPICANQFREAANASTHIAELNKISYAWDRGTFIEKGGWAIMPGSDTTNSAVAKSCAEILSTLKAADVQ